MAYKNLLNERKIIRAAQENGTVAINNRIPLQSLTAANIMVEGSIIGYETTLNRAVLGQDILGSVQTRNTSLIRLP